MTTAAKDYLTTSEAAARLKVSGKTINRWANLGKLPFARTLGEHRRYPLEAIDRLAAELEQEGGFRAE